MTRVLSIWKESLPQTLGLFVREFLIPFSDMSVAAALAFSWIAPRFPADAVGLARSRSLGKRCVPRQTARTTRAFLLAGGLHGTVEFCFPPDHKRRLLNKFRILCGWLLGAFQMKTLKNFLQAFRCALNHALW